MIHFEKKFFVIFEKNRLLQLQASWQLLLPPVTKAFYSMYVDILERLRRQKQVSPGVEIFGVSKNAKIQSTTILRTLLDSTK